MKVDRRQVLAFRLEAHHLDRRLPESAWWDALWPLGIRTAVPGAAAASLHARVEGVYGGELATALADGQAVEVMSGRGLRVVRTHDLHVFTLGAVPATDAELRSRLSRLRSAFHAGWTPQVALDTASAAAREALADGPMTDGELSRAITEHIPPELSPFCRACDCHHVEQALYRSVTQLAVLCRVPPHGTRWDRAASWIAHEPLESTYASGDPSHSSMDRTHPQHDIGRAGSRSGAGQAVARSDGSREAARTELFRRFLRGHGPATKRDVAWWFATTASAAAELLEGSRDSLVEVSYEGTPAWVHADDADELRRATSPTGVRLVPPYDPMLTTADRDTIAQDREAQQTLWRTVANSGAVVADGEIVAAWRPKKNGKRLAVTVLPFAAWQRRHLGPVEEEAQGVAVVRGCTDATVTVGRR